MARNLPAATMSLKEKKELRWKMKDRKERIRGFMQEKSNHPLTIDELLWLWTYQGSKGRTEKSAR
jgi:hypothetical protein